MSDLALLAVLACCALAAMLAWAAVPTANEEGRTGSAPVSDSESSRDSGIDAERQRDSRTGAACMSASGQSMKFTECRRVQPFDRQALVTHP
jgi:hypothetical protein